RGSSSMPMGLAFRALAALGVFRFFIDHQRLVHTFVTNVRGPTASMSFAGHDVVTMVPFAVTPGNVGVSFQVLSYAGQLVVTVVADPDVVGEQDLLTSRLQEELAYVVCRIVDPGASEPARRPLPAR
ncbi:MAG: WS/DGAT domain-containing protein, partial [Lapillicoccus sp.]